MLVDWQPRSSQNPQIPSLAPVQAVLSKVERILPLEPVPSYKGILKPNSAALKDNTTIRIAASNTIANTHAFASTPGTFGTATPGSQRFAPRHPSYPHATYPSAQAASYPPVYASQAYASSHATTQAYSQYAGGYGVNGNSYAASAYSGYASSPQGYAAYPSYAYGVGAAAYPTGTYTPTQHSTARPSQTTAQAWSYAAHTPAAALPPHMRTAASRPSGYSTPTAQPYAPWSKA
ncbi:hypothetical protein CALCODRAFT_77937 [Calocera cornea HHB12733]|uniref:Uncharacterized protein n=1 Tax=Calocera cornea HHB12733 TaxID=1353952 RepID=A0A165DGU0_9BASI|nr:hypothetical protein CALCODRAFT_77937 [Calocera cornea HHB12733]